MQDTKGNLNPISEEKYQEQMQKENPLVFKEGEILTIRGARFRVEKIMRKKMILKSLPQLKEELSELEKQLKGMD